MEKSCEYYEELISRAVDDDLSDAEKAELSAHIEACEHCRTLYNIYSMSYGENASVAPPQELLENVMASLPDSPKKKTPKRVYIGWAAAACACLLLFCIPKLFPSDEQAYGSAESSKFCYDTNTNDRTSAESALMDAADNAAEKIFEEPNAGMYSNSEGIKYFYLDELPDYITSAPDESDASVIYITAEEYKKLMIDGYEYASEATELQAGYTLIYIN